MSIQPLQLARIGTLLQSGMATSNINDIEKQLMDVQQQISTGKQFTNASQNPGDAAVAMQLQKTLAQRQTYLGNLSAGQSQLGEVDTTLGSLNDLLQQATSLASANVGSDVSDQERQGAAAVVNSLYGQALGLGNTQFEGSYIFGGDKSTDAPFVANGNGIQFVGSSNTLQNVYDANNASLSFMVDGAKVFGGVSTKVQSYADLSPNLTPDARIADAQGTTGAGVRLGSIQLGNGTTTRVIDLSKTVSFGDVVNAINAAGVGGITASLSGQGISLSGGGGDDITVKDLGGGSAAADLGILQTTGAGAGNTVVGQNVNPAITGLTPISALKAGGSIDLTSGIQITSGTKTVNVSFAGATNVQDLLNAINGAGVPVKAQINAAGTGIDILNPTQGAPMTVGENGGTTADDLGLRSFGPASPLSDFNDGKGIHFATGGPDLQVTRSDGSTFTVSLAGATVVQDVLNDINLADGGNGITASLATTGNGIVITDTVGGADAPQVDSLNFSTAAADLGLNVPASGATINGKDVNPVSTDGVFSHLAQLRDALAKGDQAGITAAAQSLKDDQDRVVRTRGEVGSRVQEMEARQGRIQDENLATQTLLSNLTDTDFTSAITKFQTLQQSLQASLQTASKVMNQSLMDFLT